MASKLERHCVTLCDKIHINNYPSENRRVYRNIWDLYSEFSSSAGLRNALENYNKQLAQGGYLRQARGIWFEENDMGPDWYTCYCYVYLPKESPALTMLKQKAKLTSPQ